MFGKRTVIDMISRSAENDADRRAFLRTAGLTGLGAVGASAATGLVGSSASAAPSDAAVFNFALNLEYLEAEFYSRAVFGRGLNPNLTTGKGNRGPVIGGREVNFSSKPVREYAREIANDEIAHVKFLRAALGSAKVARPRINLKSSFTAAARAAGLVGPNQQFDAFANEDAFLLAAFIFEDVGVTAYKGAAPLVQNKAFLEAAAGILAAEAYHAATVRVSLISKGFFGEARAISNARDKLDGPMERDQGIGFPNQYNVVPSNKNGLLRSRSAARVLNIVYLTQEKATRGGFFPRGVNGPINTSMGPGRSA